MANTILQQSFFRSYESGGVLALAVRYFLRQLEQVVRDCDLLLCQIASRRSRQDFAHFGVILMRPSASVGDVVVK